MNIQEIAVKNAVFKIVSGNRLYGTSIILSNNDNIDIFMLFDGHIFGLDHVE